MIARIWKGRTTLENFESYSSFLKEIAIPDYSKTEGFLGLSFIRKKSASVGNFELTTYWENLEVIKNFAGEDFEKAKYYPEDVHYLLEFNEKVEHFEVFANTFIT